MFTNPLLSPKSTLLFIAFFWLTLTPLAEAQPHRSQKDAARLLHDLERIQNRSSILYIAAHPDDENTRLIAFLANEFKADVTYLSITRGDGGQNLIGPELREDLGLIRTHELLEARKRDGGKQRFTRANDFGYSKHHNETFKIWDKEKVLSDVVRAIRISQPQIIITRFDTTGGHTHGHHSASAKLALEAFELASKENAFPDQLDEGLEPWQAQSIYWNAYSWRGVPEEVTNNPNTLQFNIGMKNPLLGSTYDEIAAVSRSQHKSQGFGSSPRYGELTEYLVPWKKAISKKRFIELSSLSWENDEVLMPFSKEMSQLINQFRFNDTDASTEPALSLAAKLKELHPDVSTELQKWAFENSGIRAQFTANSPLLVESTDVVASFGLNSPSGKKWEIEKILINNIPAFEIGKASIDHGLFQKEVRFRTPKNSLNASPYWLNEINGVGMYVVDNHTMIGKPMNNAPIMASIHLKRNEHEMVFEVPLEYRTTDPTKGEVVKEVGLLPEIELMPDEKLLIKADEGAFSFNIRLKNNTEGIREIRLSASNSDWDVRFEPNEIEFKEGERVKKVNVIASSPKGFGQTKLHLIATDLNSQKSFDRFSRIIEYEHIPSIRKLEKSQIKLVQLEVQSRAKKVLYIEGAGDKVAESLEQMGIEVSRVHPAELSSMSLSDYDAVLTGIRAYNVFADELNAASKQINQYVEGGGTYLIQYNTLSRNLPSKLGPLAFQLSRDRVTDEFSEVIFSIKNHPVLNSPNKISQKDFEGWVQERGLYFAAEKDAAFVSPLQFVEKGEEVSEGALIIGKYGNGHVIYTGISFFRELPAGVPGAYRLLANLISLGN